MAGRYLGGAALTALTAMLGACGDPAAQGQRDAAAIVARERGTIVQQSSESDATLPTGVERHPETGRWTLGTAPALSATDLNVPAPQPLAATTGLFIFYEKPMSIEEQKIVTENPVTVDLEMPPLYKTRLVIEKGCLRLDTGDRPLVRFASEPHLFRDAAGYLVVAGDASGAGYARIGEPVQWYMSKPGHKETEPEMLTDKEALAPIRAACGDGRVVEVPANIASSARLQHEARANAIRNWQRTYGVSATEAERAVGNCIGAACDLTPPRPVQSAIDCPSGSSLQSGVCRTPEGYLRPIPQRSGPHTP